MNRIIAVGFLVLILIISGCGIDGPIASGSDDADDLVLDHDKTPVSSNEAFWVDAPEGIEQLEGVWMESEYEIYPVGITELRVKWYNSLADMMMYGQMFTLEKEVEGVWKQVAKDADMSYGFTAEGIMLDQNDERWHDYWLQPYTDGLSQGHYRINTTFIRETIDGQDPGPGNYTNYQMYGEFNVGDIPVLREMTSFYEDTLEYKNSDYGFCVYLPMSWQGFEVIEEGPNPEHLSHDLFFALDSNYSKLIIRNPLWTVDQPYQDIVITIIETREWNNNANAATGGDLSLLPDRIGISGGYRLSKDEEDYDRSLAGYDEVMTIIESSVKAY